MSQNVTAPSSFSGTITSNGTELWTSKSQPTFRGTAPGQNSGIVVIWIDDVKYTAPIQPDGSYIFRPPQPMDEGLHNVSIHVIKVSGLIGDPVLFTVNVDTTAPNIPTIIFAHDDVGNAMGARFSNEATDDRNPTLRGNAEPGSIVKIYEGTVLLSSVQAGADGSWEQDVTLSDGKHALYATATDKLGNTSANSSGFIINIQDDDIGDHPSIDYAADNVGVKQGDLYSGDSTDDTSPTLYGFGPASSTISLRFKSNTGNWTTEKIQTAADGSWQWEPSSLAGGDYQFQVKKNGGIWSSSFTLSVNVPVSPSPDITISFTEMAYDSGISKDWITNDGRANRTVVGTLSRALLSDEQLMVNNGTGWVVATTATMNWSFVDSNSHNANWTYRLKVVNSAGDLIGKIAEQNIIFDQNIDVPVISQAWANDNEGGIAESIPRNGKTDDSSPTLTGTADAGSVVEIYVNGDVNPVGSTVAQNGVWKYTVQLENPGAYRFTVTASDVAGNQASSAEYAIEYDVAKTGSYIYDFEGITTQELTAVGDAIIGGNMRITMTSLHTPVWDSVTGMVNGVTDSIAMSSALSGSKLVTTGGVKIEFLSGISDRVTFDTAQIYYGSSITFYDKDGNTLATNRYTGTHVDFTSSNGKAIASIYINSEQILQALKKKWDYQEYDNFDFSKGTHFDVGNPIITSNGIKVISEENHHLTLEIADILQEGGQSLFIDNGTSQLMIQGDENDTFELLESNLNDNEVGSWVQKNGSVTIAGVEYHVYANDNLSTEILIQDGIHTLF